MPNRDPIPSAAGEVPLSRADQELLVRWNDTRTAYPRDKSIVALFEEHAARTPDSIAVVFGGKQLTYAALNSSANQVANYLQRIGVRQESMIGCCFERSVELIVAILGILKADAAYVPLDPGYPRAQLDHMIGDTGTSVMLTQKSLAETVLADVKVAKILLDDPQSPVWTEPGTSLQEISGSQSLAYVMYTSGSTGRPRGVMVEHRSVVRLVRNTNYCDLSADTSFLQLAPISFDASTLEIWGPLLNGGRLVMAPAQMPSLEEIGREIRDKHVNSAWLTAGLFHLMVEQRLEDLRPLKQLFAGGDVLSPWHVRQVVEKLPELRLINGYGPTEGTTFTCCHTFEPGLPVPDPVPIGKPISNSRVYILDAELQRVPIGQAGELLIGGDGLARGYLNDPEQTEAKFIMHTWEPAGMAERLYRTGDQARFLPDGVVEFLGRADNQIKLRGYRVELGEIEAVLRRHPGVRQACMVAERDGVNVKRLVAYCVASESNANAAILREYLQNSLPPHMIPASFIFLASLPLTPNGKVNRAALPALEAFSTEQPLVVSDNIPVVLETVTRIWMKILSVNQIRVEDNFFDLGGDSLQLLEAHAELERSLKITISITDLFQYTTANALANFLEGNAPKRDDFDDVQQKARKQKEVFAKQKKLRTGKIA